MRVIGGMFRSRRLQPVPGSSTRPTSDRLRETLFDVLGERVVDARFADLYAGTGAVGIEAISRGAKAVLFVEKAALAKRVLQGNLAAIGIGREASVDDRGVVAVLESYAKGDGRGAYDLVFLDPPYEMEEEYRRTLELLGGQRGERLLRDGAWVIAEHASRKSLPEQVGQLSRFRVLRQGDTALSFFVRGAPV